jgi:hypothetical protein
LWHADYKSARAVNKYYYVNPVGNTAVSRKQHGGVEKVELILLRELGNTEWQQKCMNL